MDTRLLKAFIVVFEERNITQAAQKVFVSQPALSATIRQLEASVGAALFVRSAKGVEVTEAARLLYPKAVRLVAELDQLEQIFHAPTNISFILQVMPDVGHKTLARFLAQSRERVPQCYFHLQEWGVSTPPAHARFALDVLRREEELFVCVCEDDYQLCMHKEHALTQKSVIHTDDLAGVDFIVCPPCEAHQRTLGLCSGASALRVVAQADQKNQVAALALAGVGVTFLPQSLLEECPDLVTRPFAGPRFFRRMGLCYTVEHAKHPLMLAWQET